MENRSCHHREQRAVRCRRPGLAHILRQRHQWAIRRSGRYRPTRRESRTVLASISFNLKRSSVCVQGIVFCLIAIQIRLHTGATSGTHICSREPTSAGMRLRENNDTAGEESDKRAISMSIHVTRQTTHVLDRMEGGESNLYLTDNDKLAA